MSRSVVARLYPEVGAGGFARNDNLVAFWTRVQALLRPGMTILDFGAGRGKWADLLEGYVLDLMTLRARGRRVIGVDIDEAVLRNPLVDEATIVEAGAPLPFASESFDLIVSWGVFEHITDPEFYAQELGRVLSPGGWLCAWTPNKWSYAAIGARILPNRLHARVLKRLGSRRSEEDVFPTVYLMNTRRDLERLFPPARFAHCTYVHSGPPAYHGDSAILARLILLYERLAPEGLGRSLYVFIRKKAAAEDQ